MDLPSLLYSVHTISKTYYLTYFVFITLDWIVKIIEAKDALLKKCENIFNIITDKNDILDYLWNYVWDQVRQTISVCYYLVIKITTLATNHLFNTIQFST